MGPKEKIDNHSMKTDIYIVPNKVMHYSIIFGRDILCKQDKRLTIEFGALRAETAPLSVFKVGQDLNEEEQVT